MLSYLMILLQKNIHNAHIFKNKIFSNDKIPLYVFIFYSMLIVDIQTDMFWS